MNSFQEKDMPDEPADDGKQCRYHMTRRGFLLTMGAGSAVVAASGALAAASPGAGTEILTPGEMSKLTLDINGRSYPLLVEPRWSLLFVLREKMGLTGTKVGCERGECGACTVLINDTPRYACMTLAVEAAGTRIVTLEGLKEGEELGPVQQAFVEHDALQCGYCTPGQIMAVEGLLRANPQPSLAEIRVGVSGNLCRCGAYVHIFEAAQRAAELKAGKVS